MGRKLDPSNWKIKKAPSFPEPPESFSSPPQTLVLPLPLRRRRRQLLTGGKAKGLFPLSRDRKREEGRKGGKRQLFRRLFLLPGKLGPFLPLANCSFSAPSPLPESPLRSSATEGGDGSVEGGGEIGVVSAGAVGAVLSQGPEREVRIKNRFTEHLNKKYYVIGESLSSGSDRRPRYRRTFPER